MRLAPIHALAAAAIALIGTAALPISNADAGSLLTPLAQTCTTIDCNALIVGGSYQFDQFGQADPFVTQVYATATSCLRVDVLAQETDLEATLVAADGTIWQNDDRSSGNTLPLIKASVPAGKGGWYALVISKYNGVGPGANFKVALGTYTVGSPNCVTPTTPRSANTFSARDAQVK